MGFLLIERFAEHCLEVINTMKTIIPPKTIFFAASMCLNCLRYSVYNLEPREIRKGYFWALRNESQSKLSGCIPLIPALGKQRQEDPATASQSASMTSMRHTPS